MPTLRSTLPTCIPQRFSGLDVTDRFSGRCPWCHLCCGCCCGRTGRATACKPAADDISSNPAAQVVTPVPIDRPFQRKKPPAGPISQTAREWRCFSLTAACAQWFGCGPSTAFLANQAPIHCGCPAGSHGRDLVSRLRRDHSANLVGVWLGRSVRR